MMMILSPTDQSDYKDFIEKYATVFAKLIQYLDDKSLLIRNARYKGRKALRILMKHYLSKGKSNLKPFTTVITQKQKTLTFSEFKVCLRSYEETDHMCYSHPQMNPTIYFKWKPHLKKLNQGINLG